MKQSNSLYKVLIVDDEEIIRTSLCSLFPWETFGFEVCSSFDNGLKALAYLKCYHCDVVLTDIKMPLYSGLELLEAMRNQMINIPVVVLTTYDTFSFVQQCIRLKAVKYLVKPIRYQELASTFTSLYNEIEKEQKLKQARLQSLTTFDATKQLIETDSQNCNLQTLSKVLNLTTDDFLNQFENEAGESFFSYAKRWKMEKAKELLNFPIIQISEIARAIGFSQPNNFTRAFRDYYGYSPTQFRNGGQ
ncbi:MAG: response regulator transcription factor [Peptococcales bacterium]